MTRILWLSDVHYKVKYNKEPKIKQYIDNFLKSVEHIQKVKSIDFIVITGDISFSSHLNEFKWFRNDILDEIKTRTPSAKSILVPGNHDVLWESVKNLFFSAEEDFEISRWKQELLSNDPDKMAPLLKFFSNFSFHANEIMSFKSENIDINLNDEAVFGFIYFKEKNILFLLINSCFFSFGEVPQSVLKNKLINLIKLKVFSATNNIITISGISYSELGNQIYALDLIDWAKIEIIIKEYMPLVIALAHHPPSWLDWNELYTNSPTGTVPFYEKLIKNVDLLLTGHEHISLQRNGDRIANKTWLFKAPKFLDDNLTITDPDPFQNNWFTLLDIEDDSMLCVRKSYNYRNDIKEWKEHEVIDKFVIRNPNHLIQSQIDSEIEIGDILDLSEIELISKPSVTKLRQYFSVVNKMASCDGKIKISQIRNGGYKFYDGICDETIRLIIIDIKPLMKKKEEKESVLGNPGASSPYNAVINQLKESKAKEKIVSFIQFYRIKPIKDKPSASKKTIALNRNSSFAVLRLKKFDEFQSFRHDFFHHKMKKDVFSRLADIKFSFHFVDYDFEINKNKIH